LKDWENGKYRDQEKEDGEWTGEVHPEDLELVQRND